MFEHYHLRNDCTKKNNPSFPFSSNHFTNIFHRWLSRTKNYASFFVSLFPSFLSIKKRYFAYPPRSFSLAPPSRVNSNPYLLIAHIVQWISITSANYLIGRFSTGGWPRILVITFHYENCQHYRARRYFKSFIPFQSLSLWKPSQILIHTN